MWAIELFLKRVLVVGYLALCGISLFILTQVEANVTCIADSEYLFPLTEVSLERNGVNVSHRFYLVLIIF